MNEVFGRAVLPLVKERCEVFRNDLAGKEIKIIRFAPDQKVSTFELAKYEAARFSTESKIKTFQYLGCIVESPLLAASTTKTDFNKLISNFDLDPNIIGIIVQNPIPIRLEGGLSQISYLKDLDGMRPDNPYFRTSATSETIFRLVESFALKTDSVAVVGAKGFVGGGVVKLLKEAGINTIELDVGDDLLRTRDVNISPIQI